MYKIQIEIGKNYGSWKVIKEEEKHNGIRMFLAQCICGKTRLATPRQLILHKTNKCCCRKGNKHGLSKHPLFSTWYSMIERCENPKVKCYELYGGRGIKVCDEWKDKEKGFVNFYNWAFENGYVYEKLPSGRNRLTIDRIDGTKNYSPDNCRWVDQTIQCCNRNFLPTNTSGYRGVSWSKTERKWISVISIKHKTIRLGGFATQKQAVETRNNYIDEHNLPHRKSEYIGELKNGRNDY